MRSFEKYLSTRPKYWVPFRKLVELKMPESNIDVEQGRLNVAAVPQVPGKMSLAVLTTVVPPMLVGTYVFRMWVPNVPGNVAWAKEANAGSGKILVWLPVDTEERNASTPK